MRVEVTKAWLETPEKICLEWSTDFDDSDVFKKHSLIIAYDKEVSFSSELATFIFIDTILVCYCKYYYESIIKFTLPIDLSKSLQLNIEKYHSISFTSNSVIDLNIRETYSNSISKHENALFYGGGKDYLLSALLQRSISGAENTDYDYFWFSAYELDLITSKDPNASAEIEKILSLLDNARIGISYKSKFVGLNREREVLYDYS